MKTNESGAGFGAIGKERSKLLPVLAIAMIAFLGTFIVVSEGEASEATPDGTPVSSYEELKVAFSTGGTYYLSEDITISVSSALKVTSDIVLDLNGRTLEKTKEVLNNFIIKVEGSSFEIDDSLGGGMIKSVDYGIQLRSNSSFVLNGGSIESREQSIDIWDSSENVSITINDGSVKSTKDNVLGIYGNSNINVNIHGGKLNGMGRVGVYISSYKECPINFTMDGGEYTGVGIQAYRGSNITIGGDASFNCPGHILHIQDNTHVTVNGGKFVTNDVVFTTDSGPGFNPTLTISGGEFEGELLNATSYSNKVNNSVITIDGTGIPISGTLTGNAKVVINAGASADIQDLKIEATNVIENNGTLDFSKPITGTTTAANLTGTGIVLRYTESGFSDCISVDANASSIKVNNDNHATVLGSMVKNPDMYEGIVTVTTSGTINISGEVTVPAGVTFSFDESGANISAVGDSIILDEGASITGIIGIGGSATVTATGLTAGNSGLTISYGSIIFDGDATAGDVTLTSSDGEVIKLTGTLAADVTLTIEQGSESKVPVRFEDFDANGGKVLFKAYGSEDSYESIPEWVDGIYAGNVSVGGLTIVNDDVYTYNGQPQYPSEIRASMSGITSQGMIKSDLSGFAISAEEIGVYDAGLNPTTATDVGTYYVYYGYYADSVLHLFLCEWKIEPAKLNITIDYTDAYDGENLEVSLAGGVEGVTVTGLIPGDSIVSGTVTTNGSDVGVYSDAEQWVLSGIETEMGIANYTVVFESVSLTITPRPVTVCVSDRTTYDGQIFTYELTAEDVMNLPDGHFVSGSVVTNGSDAGEYTIADSAVTPSITLTGGDSNYVITYDVTLTIDKAELTVSDVAVEQKTYDGSTDATISNVTFEGYAVADVQLTINTDFTVTGAFRDADAGDDKEVDVTITPVDGSANLKNYTIPTTYVATGTISKATLTLSDAELEEKVYNGSSKWDSVSSVTFADSDDNAVTLDSDDYQVSAATADGTADAGTSPDYAKAATVTVTLNADLNYAFVDGLTATYEVSDAVLKPLEVTSDMVIINKSSVDGKFFAKISVVSGELSLDTFTASVTGPNEGSAVESDGRYELTETGTYKFTVSSTTDTNWFVPGGGVTLTVDVQLYEVRFHTRTTVGGEYEQEQVVYGSSVMTPMASKVPEGYVLKGWSASENGNVEYSPQVYIAVPAIGLDLYAVYEEESAGVTPTPGDKPTVSISLPGSFTVGNSAIFSVTTTKGDYVGNVIGTGSFSGKAGDYSIWYWGGDYYANAGGWVEWTEGNFGGDSGFPMSDAMTHFKVVFHNAGQYSLIIKMESVNGNEVVCQDSAIITVEPRVTELSPSLDVTVPSTVYAGEEFEFYVTTLGSYDSAVRGKYVGTGSGFDVKYIDENGGLWPLDDGFFGPAGGFTYQAGATSAFKATFSETGTYRFTISIVDAGSQAEVCSKVVYITVLASPSEEVPEPEVYTVKFVDSDGTEVKVVGDLASGAATILPVEFSVGGAICTVDGWKVGNDYVPCSAGYYFVDPSHAGESNTIALTAVVSEVQEPVMVTYYLGEKALKSQKMYPGDCFEFPQVPLADGKHFDGWFTDAGLTADAGTVLPDDASGVYALYAKVTGESGEITPTVTYTVSFMNGDATLTYTGYTDLAEGTTVALPSSVDGVDPAKYRLNGWCIEGKMPMTTYTVRGVDANTDNVIVLYADIVQYVFSVTSESTENGSFSTFVDNGILRIFVTPASGYAVDKVEVKAGGQAIDCVASSENVFYANITSDVTVSVTFRSVAGEQNPDDVSTNVGVAVGSTVNGVQIQLTAHDGVLPSSLDVTVKYYYQETSNGMIGFGSQTVVHSNTSIADDVKLWNEDFDLSSEVSYDTAYICFATITYNIGDKAFTAQSVLTNIIHAPA